MSAKDEAWDRFVEKVRQVAAGIEEPTRAVAAGKVYAAAAVAEAREPLVAALEAIAEHPHCEYAREPEELAKNRRQYDMGVADGHRCAAGIAAAALADAKGETP